MAGDTFLEGDRITLRPMDEEDYELIASQWNRPGVRQQAGWPQLPLRGDDIEAVAERGDGGAGFLACHDDRAVGFVVLHDLDWQARLTEISYVVRPDEQANGYATEAVSVCLEYAFVELGLHKVHDKVWEDNEGSVQVLEKMGFDQEGVLRDHWYSFGEYSDEYLFGLLESEWETPSL